MADIPAAEEQALQEDGEGDEAGEVEERVGDLEGGGEVGFGDWWVFFSVKGVWGKGWEKGERTAWEEAREEFYAGEGDVGPDGAEEEKVDGGGRADGRGRVVPVGDCFVWCQFLGVGYCAVRLGFGYARVSPKPERTSTNAANTPCVALRIRVKGDAMLVSFIMLGGETGRCTAQRRFLETKTETRKIREKEKMSNRNEEMTGARWRAKRETGGRHVV